MAPVEELWWPDLQALCQEIGQASPDGRAAIVTRRKELLERGLDVFKPPSKASEELIRGDQPIKLPEGESLPSHTGMRDALLDLSAKLELDQVQTYILLSRLCRTWGLGPVQGPGLDLEQFLAAKVYYFSERLQLLGCIQDVLEAGETETTEDLDAALQAVAPALEAKSAAALLRALQGTGYPAELEGPQLTAKQRLLEQAALCATLALLYYFPRCQPTPERFLELAGAAERHLLRAQVAHQAAGDEAAVARARWAALVLLIEMLDPERVVAVVGRDADGGGPADRVSQTALRDAATLSRVNELVGSWWHAATPAHGPLLLVWAATLQLLGEGQDVEGPRAAAHAELAGQLGALGALPQLAGAARPGGDGPGAVMAETGASVLLAAAAAVLCAFNLSPLALPWPSTRLLLETLCSLFQDQPALCEAFWAQQRPSDPPLLAFLDELRSLFPAQPAPLWTLLAALSASAPSAASALAYASHVPALCTLEDAAGEALLPDPDADGDVIAGDELAIPGLPSVRLAAGASGRSGPLPEGLPALRDGAQPLEPCLVVWAAPLEEGRGLEAGLERALVALGAALARPPEAAERLVEVAALLRLLAAWVKQDATLGHDLAHVRCVRVGDGGVTDPLTLALLVLGALGPRARELDARGISMLGDALSFCAGMVSLAPKRVEAALEGLQEETLSALLERELQVSEDERPVTMGLLSLVTALVCTAPSADSLLVKARGNSLVGGCCGLLVAPGRAAPAAVAAGALRLLRLVLSTPGWEEESGRLLGALLPNGSLAFVLGTVLQARRGPSLESSLREFCRALAVVLPTAPQRVRLTEGLTGWAGALAGDNAAGLAGSALAIGGRREQAAQRDADFHLSTPLSVLLHSCARSAWAGPEDKALILQTLRVAVRCGEGSLGAALGDRDVAVLRALVAEAATAEAARSHPNLFAAALGLWTAALEAGPGRQAGVLRALVVDVWQADEGANERMLSLPAAPSAPDSPTASPLQAVVKALGSLASLPAGTATLAALRLWTAAHAAAASVPALWRALREEAAPYRALEELLSRALDASDGEERPAEDECVLIEALAAALACLVLEPRSALIKSEAKEAVNGTSGPAADAVASLRSLIVSAALPVLRCVLRDRTAEEESAAQETRRAAGAVLPALGAACAADAALDRAAGPASRSLLAALLSAPDGAEAVIALARPSSAAAALRWPAGGDGIALRRRLGLLAALAPAELRDLESALAQRDATRRAREAAERRARPLLLAWLRLGGAGPWAPAEARRAAEGCLALLVEGAARPTEGGPDADDVAGVQLQTLAALVSAAHPAEAADAAAIAAQALDALQRWLGAGAALAPGEDGRTGVCLGLAELSLRLLAVIETGAHAEESLGAAEPAWRAQLVTVAARLVRPLVRSALQTLVAAEGALTEGQSAADTRAPTLVRLAATLLDPELLPPFFWREALSGLLEPAVVLNPRAQPAVWRAGLELLLQVGAAPAGAALLVQLGAADAALRLLRHILNRTQERDGARSDARTWTLALTLVAQLSGAGPTGADSLIEGFVVAESRLLASLDSLLAAEQPITMLACQEAEASLSFLLALLSHRGVWEANAPGSIADFRAATAEFLERTAACGVLGPPAAQSATPCQPVTAEDFACCRVPGLDGEEEGGVPFALRVLADSPLLAGEPAGAVKPDGSLFAWRLAAALARCVQGALAFQLASAPELDEVEAEAPGPTWVGAEALGALGEALLNLGSMAREASGSDACAARLTQAATAGASAAGALLLRLGRLEEETQLSSQLAGLLGRR